jgi:ribosomal protein S18 acetylase RimI-like enzyme
VHSDREALRYIAVVTGDAGEDASSLHPDPGIVGDIYAVPYVDHAPSLCFVAEQNGQVSGYCVGAPDTQKYEEWLQANWWPELRDTYPLGAPTSNADASMRGLVHSPTQTPERLVHRFPAHLHLATLPEIRGQGVASRLVEFWMRAATAAGVRAAHVGVDPRNERGQAFWRTQGFVAQTGYDGSTVWMGRDLG